MRWICWLLFMLLGLIWLASEIRLPGEGLETHQDTGWRRTEDGWQPASQLIPKAPARQPALHPWVVGCLELMLAVLALVAFPPVKNIVHFGRNRKMTTAKRQAAVPPEPCGDQR